MALKVDVSVGELLDKITILEIKSERVHDEEKLKNIRKELDLLRSIWSASPLSNHDISEQMTRLKAVNERLWDIEDNIRRKEADQAFDDGFVELARSVYKENDQRAAIKRELNVMLGSELVEEKSYTDYFTPAALRETAMTERVALNLIERADNVTQVAVPIVGSMAVAEALLH